MSRQTIFILVLIFIIIFLLSCSYIDKKPDNILSESEFAIPTGIGRQVICEKARELPCGLKLSKCSDGLEYTCTNNIIIFDTKKPLSRSEQDI